jgi:hypothetical protein
MQSAEILEETNSSDFEIFPNPTSDYIHLKSTEFENCKLIKLFSINGKLEKSIPFDTIISIEDLKDGVYYIQFSSEDKNFRKKIIKL